MAVFSNGSEGCSFEANVCGHCEHWKFDEKTKTEGCPVWDAHMSYNGDQHTDGKLNDLGTVLAMLIPQPDKRGFRCHMHMDKKPDQDS